MLLSNPLEGQNEEESRDPFWSTKPPVAADSQPAGPCHGRDQNPRRVAGQETLARLFPVHTPT